ncbi:hypothetical protein EYM_01220 [Ignicoccus islandicus DSM 13165]|uniref:Uncharacterized protein n=1 Tax=Ignicoccus islandicus DSM 13165 TaxID=940295 RepID=A0A0U3FPR7_9CREN|nr:hypothetical protein [Ignicoccus islandicus]ALU11456.1 hypothetical protein EYM_01220 [Ignicoccus islandicus DSM 13165]
MPKWWNWFGRGMGGRGPGWGRGWRGRGPGPCWWLWAQERGITPPTPEEIERTFDEIPPFWAPGRGWWFWYYYMKEKEKK